MGKFIAKRLAFSVVILFFVTFIIYVLECSLPSGYIETTARQLATQPGTTKSAQDWIDELNAQYGMDKGVVQGYFVWLGNSLRGNFGDSWSQTIPVTDLFNKCIWYSFVMGAIAFVLQIVILIPNYEIVLKKSFLNFIQKQ